MANWCDHPASKAICRYGVPAARVYCAYCSPRGELGAPNVPRDSFFSEKSCLETDYNPELDEDPDNRPYIWDIPEGDCKCH